MRLLLVEDDVSLGHGIQAGLALSDHSVDWVTDGDGAGRVLQRERFDVVVLDLGLPRTPGLEVLRHMRSRGDDTPVLVLTARDAVVDRVEGLDAGCDDYMTKPFDLDELAARLRALHRRHVGHAPVRLQQGGLSVDLAAQTVTLHDLPVRVSPHEFAILRMLLENAGRVLPRSMLEQGLYGMNIEIESNTVEVHIHFLRKKLGERIIRTVRGVGYIIDTCD
jgi:two-component system, OmpR family, response regulator QseB